MNQNSSIFSLGLWRSVWRISKPFFTSGDPWFTAYGIRPDLSDAGKQRLNSFLKLTAKWALAPLLVFLAVFAIGGIFNGLGTISHDWASFFYPATSPKVDANFHLRAVQRPGRHKPAWSLSNVQFSGCLPPDAMSTSRRP